MVRISIYLKYCEEKTWLNTREISKITHRPFQAQDVSFYALHVALQTLKERCMHLQQRVGTLEEENETLRKTTGMDRPDFVPGEDNDEYLRGMVGDLVRQKSQLTDHISMVTNENRQLWSRLSKLTKENSSLGVSISKIREAINGPTTQTPSSGGALGRNNNLIRSKTFTRPNPKLRTVAPEREMDAADGDEDEEEGNMSLEEISLQIINKLVEGKENFEQKCEEILDKTTTENLCFGFNDAGGAGRASQVDSCQIDEVADTIEKCTNDATTMKDVLLQQQSQLKRLIMGLKESKSK